MRICSKSRAASCFIPEMLPPNRRMVARPNVAIIENLKPVVRTIQYTAGYNAPLIKPLAGISPYGDENADKVRKRSLPDAKFKFMHLIRHK